MALFKGHPKVSTVCLVAIILGLCHVARPLEFAGGTGEPNDPYQIATAEQLIAIGSDPNLLDKHFALTADIDMVAWRQSGAVIATTTGYVDAGILGSQLFEGTIDGQGYAIRNLTLQAPDGTGSLGLFGRLGTHARVFGVRLVDVSVSVGNEVTDVGGLAGSSDGVVLDCRISGSFSAGKSLHNLGGLVGTNRGVVVGSTASITAAVASVSFNGERYAGSIGGLVGANYGTVACSTAKSKITTAAGAASVGGLVGQNEGGVVVNCSAAGAVMGGWSSGPLGGLVGYNYSGSVINCFSTSAVGAGNHSSVGRLVGSSSIGVSRCYFLDPNDGAKWDNGAGTVLSDLQMRRQASFAGWDFLGQSEDGTSEAWMMPPDGGYPVPSVLQGYQPVALPGSGTADDPFLIETVEQLGAVAYRPGAHYRLGEDIDASGITWSSPVIPGLMVSLDGAGHRITHLSVDSSGHAGLVGLVHAEANISNLAVEEAIITGQAFSCSIGAVAGANQGLISACHATGVVAGRDAVGGLVGVNTGTVSDSWADCAVSSGSKLGGLVGANLGGVLRACYAAGPVESTGWRVGGLVGAVSDGEVESCYARGSVTGGDCVGGLVGQHIGGTLIRCLSTGQVRSGGRIGGLVGQAEAPVLNCLWDVQVSGVSQSAGGLGFSTSEMMSVQTYALNGWAGDSNWLLDEGRDYPHLAWEGKAGQPIPEPAIDWLSGNGTAEVPFKIESAQQLQAIARTSILWDRHFVLDTDLDLTGMMFEPIAGGGSPGFAGVFDGAGHTLRNLTIRRNNQGAQYVGLFGRVRWGGQIRNLIVEDANVLAVSSVSYVGILAGGSEGSNISGCRVTGRIQCKYDSRSVGGLAGYTNGVVRACHANVAIAIGGGAAIGGLAGSHLGSAMEDCSAGGSIEVATGGWNLGGLVGFNDARIARCRASGSIVAGTDSELVGGLIGGNSGESVVDSYAIGRVQGGDWLGGLIGYVSYNQPPSEISRCWAAGQVVGRQGANVGGLIGGDVYTNVTCCYRLNASSGGGPDRGHGTPLSSEQMKQKASFGGWDFETVWSICEGKDYPRLQWEQSECE